MLITQVIFCPPDIEGAEWRADITLLGHILIKGLHITKDNEIIYPSNMQPANSAVDRILRSQILNFYWDFKHPN